MRSLQGKETRGCFPQVHVEQATLAGPKMCMLGLLEASVHIPELQNLPCVPRSTMQEAKVYRRDHTFTYTGQARHDGTDTKFPVQHLPANHLQLWQANAPKQDKKKPKSRYPTEIRVLRLPDQKSIRKRCTAQTCQNKQLSAATSTGFAQKCDYFLRIWGHNNGLCSGMQLLSQKFAER